MNFKMKLKILLAEFEEHWILQVFFPYSVHFP